MAQKQKLFTKIINTDLFTESLAKEKMNEFYKFRNEINEFLSKHKQSEVKIIKTESNDSFLTFFVVVDYIE